MEQVQTITLSMQWGENRRSPHNQALKLTGETSGFALSALV